MLRSMPCTLVSHPYDSKAPRTLTPVPDRVYRGLPGSRHGPSRPGRGQASPRVASKAYFRERQRCSGSSFKPWSRSIRSNGLRSTRFSGATSRFMKPLITTGSWLTSTPLSKIRAFTTFRAGSVANTGNSRPKSSSQLRSAYPTLAFRRLSVIGSPRSSTRTRITITESTGFLDLGARDNKSAAQVDHLISQIERAILATKLRSGWAATDDSQARIRAAVCL